MMNVRIRIGLVLAVIALCAIVAGGCGKKAEEVTAEKMMGKAMSAATGKETKVDLNNGNVHVENKDMKVDIASSSTWPADMFADVPKFTDGTIERVVSSNEGGMKKFNIYFNSIKDGSIKQYTQSLKSKGWDANLMDMGKAGIISASKGNLGISFSYSAEKKDGMLAAFSTQ
jgi:hypothetical protein